MCYGKKNIHTSKCQPGTGVYKTEVIRSMPKGVCGLFGDPHIVTFDNPTGATLNQFSTGEYYLVKSSALQVSGRFGFSERFPKEASTIGIAVGGTLLNGHTITVQYVGGAKGREGFKAFYDGQEILTNFPSDFESPGGEITAEYKDMDPDAEHEKARHTIGGKSGLLPSYRLHFLPDWKIYVLLGEETMNVVIEMQLQPGGQDGYCGNFNCDASDDTMDGLKTRGIADQVPESESLFKGTPAPAKGQFSDKPAPVFSLEDCDANIRVKAETGCAKMEDQAMKDACIYDACAAGSMQVVNDDVSASEMEVREEIDAGEIAGKFFNGLLHLGGPSLPWQFFAGMACMLGASLVGCTMLGRASRGRYQRVSALDGPDVRSGIVPSAASRLLGVFTSRGRGAGYEDLFEDDGSARALCSPSAAARHRSDWDTVDEEEANGLLA